MESETSEPEVRQRKPRSKIERAITWSVIVILLVIVFFEWRARNGYTKTLNAIDRASKNSEEDPSATPVTLSSVGKLVAGSPTKTDGKTPLNKTVLYTWRGLTGLRVYTILVTLEGTLNAADPMLLSFETGSTESNHEAILEEGAPETVRFFPEKDDSAPGTPVTVPGFSPAGGPLPPGMAPRSFEDIDKDADGKIVKEEASERMRQSFDQNDTNSDGGIDKEEFDAMRQRSRAQREGQNTTTAPPRPQRPEGESNDKPDQKE